MSRRGWHPHHTPHAAPREKKIPQSAESRVITPSRAGPYRYRKSPEGHLRRSPAPRSGRSTETARPAPTTLVLVGLCPPVRDLASDGGRFLRFGSVSCGAAEPRVGQRRRQRVLDATFVPRRQRASRPRVEARHYCEVLQLARFSRFALIICLFLSVCPGRQPFPQCLSLRSLVGGIVSYKLRTVVFCARRLHSRPFYYPPFLRVGARWASSHRIYPTSLSPFRSEVCRERGTCAGDVLPGVGRVCERSCDLPSAHSGPSFSGRDGTQSGFRMQW